MSSGTVHDPIADHLIMKAKLAEREVRV